MGMKISAWQALLLYHIENGTVFNGNPVVHDGSTVIALDRLHIDGEVRIAGNVVEVTASKIILTVPASIAMSLEGQPLSGLLAITPMGLREIDDGYAASIIKRVNAEDGKHHFEIESPDLDLEKLHKQRRDASA